ncbi:MAG TPA: 4a-hydroxytetrahydrobiopterin dehydratase [Actinomycetota bacterium]|jgi:4a-hydroxytetrahydrobiopterin dehydratase
MRLPDDLIKEELENLPGWSYVGGKLFKEFRYRGFRSAIAFVNRVAELAIAVGHHPDVEIHDDAVLLSLTTHDEGGVTDADISMARQIETVVEPPGA